jgi:hypothetical protein
MMNPAKRTERQEAAITALLMIAGIVLAICLFAAGLFWGASQEPKGQRGAASMR